MRLDEAVKAFLDGKVVEHPNGHMLTKHSDGLRCDRALEWVKCWPIDGWRLKRETLTPMEAWSRMKAGKVVRSDAGLRNFQLNNGCVLVKLDGESWVASCLTMCHFLDATDLYEVEAG